MPGINLNPAKLFGGFGKPRTTSFEPRNPSPEKKATYEKEVKAWLESPDMKIGTLTNVKFVGQATKSDIQKFEKQQKGDNITDFKSSVAHSLYNNQAPFLLEVTNKEGKTATVLAFEYEGGKHVSTWPRDIQWSDKAATANPGWGPK